MKIKVTFFSLLLATLTFTSVSFGTGINDKVFEKLGRGAVNIVTCPVELAAQPAAAKQEDVSDVMALAKGVPKGLVMMFVRGGAGIYELLTFPFPMEQNYEPVINPPTLFDQRTE